MRYLSKISLILLALVTFLALSRPLYATAANYKGEGKVKLKTSLFKSPEGDAHLVLHYQNNPHWHTYWKNPGDSGLPIKFKFSVDGQDLVLPPLEWPKPSRFIEQGDIWAFGQEGEYAIFFPLSESTQKALTNKTIDIHSSWLVCKDICIPGEQKFSATLQANPLKLNSSQLSTTSHSKFSEIFANLPTEQSFPRELDLTLALSKSKEGLTLFYSHPVKRGEKISSSNNFLTPFPILPFDFQHEKLFLDKKGNLYGKMEIDWDGEYQEPEVPLPANGKFKKPYTLKFLYQPPGMEQAQVISKTFSQFDLNTSEQMTSFFSLVRPVPPPKAKSKTALPADDPNGHENLSNQAEENSSNSTSSLLFYLLLAFIGGFILNFMPCVLPVISLKLFSLINSRDKSKRTILKHNLFYTLGILSSFLILAIVIATLKSSGVSVGWGMQLQSPHFNIVMIIILFIFALNLFSLFEFNTPGGSKLGSISTGEGGLADFFNGVLATVLSTPCSAPFLGTALTFALLAPAHIIILVFLAIGFGLAAPFILTAFFPALITFLPKPGLWMEHLKRFLGLSILLTIVWLFNILSNQVDDRFLIPLLLMTLLFIFFSLYMQKQLKSSPLFKTIMAIVPIPMLIYLTIFIKSTSLVSDVTPSPTVTSAQNSEGLTWIPWSPAKMEELQKSGTPTFIDFTAKWCFTCKVNEKLVIHTDDFTQLAKKYQLKLLLADWTKRDPIIGDWLLAHGYAGVPAYFVINNQGKIIPLGETISISEIEEALK